MTQATQEKLTFDSIQEALAPYYCTEKYTRHEIMRSVLMTDGVVKLREFANCYWLIDMVVSYYPKIMRNNIKTQDTFNLIQLKVTGTKATFEVNKGNEDKPFIVQKIDYTDMPEGTYKLYLIDNVLLLPSEY